MLSGDRGKGWSLTPYIMLLAVGNGQKCRQGSGMVIETVHLNRPFGRSELCPGKNRQTQIYGGCIDRIQRVLETEICVLVSGSYSESKGDKTALQHPVVPFGIGIRKRAFVYSSKPKMIPTVCMSR